MTIKVAESFNDPTADVALCSSDNVVFKLHKVILALASDFFKDMFGLPQPPASQPNATDSEKTELPDMFDGLPLIRVTEPSVVLDKLFHLCYPLEDSTLSSIAEVRGVLAAALKYDLRKVIAFAKRQFRKHCPSTPMQAYAVACILSLGDEALVAANEVRKQKLQDHYVEELEEIPIGAYQRLLNFCQSTVFSVKPNFFFPIPSTRGLTTGKPGKKGELTGNPSFTHFATSDKTFSPKSTLAPYPFDAPDADVIVDTSDGVRYRLYKHLIQLSSPVLRSMVQDQGSADVPLVVAEPSRIMSILFQICSPSDNPTLTDLLEVHDALVAAEKYKMRKAVQFLQGILATQRDVFADADPLLLYCVACHLELRDLALFAAHRTLRMDLRTALFPKLDAININAGYLYRLLEYHRQCLAEVRTMFTNMDWLEAQWKEEFFKEKCRESSYCSGPAKPCWYAPYMQELSTVTWPKAVDALNPSAIEVGMAWMSSYPSCGHCATAKSFSTFVRFTRYVADTIDAKEKKITLTWPSVAETQESVGAIASV